VPIRIKTAKPFHVKPEYIQLVLNFNTVCNNCSFTYFKLDSSLSFNITTIGLMISHLIDTQLQQWAGFNYNKNVVHNCCVQTLMFTKTSVFIVKEIIMSFDVVHSLY